MPEAAKACGLRKGRYSEVGRVYLLTVVVYERKPVFADWRIGRLLVEQMRAVDEEGLVRSLAWIVMPDWFSVWGIILCGMRFGFKVKRSSEGSGRDRTIF